MGNGVEAEGGRGGGGGMQIGDEESPWNDDVCDAGDVEACATMMVCGLLPIDATGSPFRTLLARSILLTAFLRIVLTCSRSSGLIAAICSSLSDSSRTTFRKCASCASSTGELPCEAERMTPTSARMQWRTSSDEPMLESRGECVALVPRGGRRPRGAGQSRGAARSTGSLVGAAPTQPRPWSFRCLASRVRAPFRRPSSTGRAVGSGGEWGAALVALPLQLDCTRVP
mmetsp:Transcript_8704/g.21492  ORF Transcript_8704/g.21492 Transcript_8704/m.21492 type:complete len:228 (+) Transcript_8704:540-1223(+)